MAKEKKSEKRNVEKGLETKIKQCEFQIKEKVEILNGKGREINRIQEEGNAAIKTLDEARNKLTTEILKLQGKIEGIKEIIRE